MRTYEYATLRLTGGERNLLLQALRAFRPKTKRQQERLESLIAEAQTLRSDERGRPYRWT